MARQVRLAVAVAALTAAHAVGEGAAQHPDSVARAVRYVEHRTNNRARVIPTGGEAMAGIDINSSVRIEVDEERLERALAAGGAHRPETAALLSRIAALKAATEAIPPFRAALQAALAAWDAAEASGRYDTLLVLIRRMGFLEESVVAPLDSAIAWRLRAAGKSPEEVRRESQEIRRGLRAFGTGQYDWDRLTRHLALEIGLLSAELESRRPPDALEIEVQAHRIGSSGAVAIALPRYNQETVGPLQVFEKVQFSIPAAERQLYEQYSGLAASVGTTVSFGQAMRRSLEAEFQSERAAIEAAIGAARELFTTAETELRRVGERVSGDSLEAWLEQYRQTLDASPEGQRARALGLELAGLLLEFRLELQVLERYASLGPALPSMAPQQALAAILQAGRGSSALVRRRVLNPNVWGRRAEVMHQFVAAMRGLAAPALRASVADPNGPVAVLGSAAPKVGAAAARLRAAGSTVVSWLDNLATGTPALAAAELPIPTGQQRIALSEDQADTEFDLQTIRSGRELDDRVVVVVRFYRDGVRQPVELSQRFRIQSYGWNARFIASLAWLTRQGRDLVFRAAPAMSWMARYRSWPGDSDRGLGGAWAGGLGVGITAVSLDFMDTEQVELGLAPTLGLLNDRILIGAGLNLQATDERFFGFFSIRLFSVSGGIGP